MPVFPQPLSFALWSRDDSPKRPRLLHAGLSRGRHRAVERPRLAALGRHERARALVIALVALAWSLKLASAAWAGPWVWNEVQRETAGVLLVAVVMLLAWRSPGAAERG